MHEIAKGIAHVSFSGGGVFLPARSPYDRQMLVEHIGDRVRAKGRVQVLIGDERWIVQLNRRAASGRCASCSVALDSICYSAASDSLAFCARCAFGGRAHTVPHPELQRSAS